MEGRGSGPKGGLVGPRERGRVLRSTDMMREQKGGSARMA
jgi:hypothetical protein